MAVSAEYDGLWHCVASVHQGARSLAIGPADTKAKMKIAREFLYLVAGGERIFSGESNELNLFARELLPHLLVVRNFAAAWSAPGGPDVDYDDFATEVSKTKSSVIDRLKFVIDQAFRESTRIGRSQGHLIGFLSE